MAVLIQNKKVHRNFEILETLEAGISLRGFEVKSARNHRGTLAGARVAVRGGDAYLIGATIPPYQPGNTPGEYEPDRPRRLLLNKKELDMLMGYEAQKGLTVIPVSMYTKGRNIKLQIAIARGKKKHDKRETIKAREAKRRMERALKGAAR